MGLPGSSLDSRSGVLSCLCCQVAPTGSTVIFCLWLNAHFFLGYLAFLWLPRFLICNFSACAGPQTGSLKTAEVHSSPPDQAGCALRELSGPREAPSLPAQFSCADPSAAVPGPGVQRNRGEKCAHVVQTDGPVSLPTEKRTARRSPEGEACRGGRTRQKATGLRGSQQRPGRRPPHAGAPGRLICPRCLRCVAAARSLPVGQSWLEPLPEETRLCPPLRGAQCGRWMLSSFCGLPQPADSP